MKLPEMAVLLIRLIGHEAALRMMKPSNYGGKVFEVPKGELHRGEQTFHALAEVVGIDNAHRIFRHFGGDRIYIPLLDDLWRHERNRKIVGAYNGGTSVWQLSSEHRLTVRQVWNILKHTDMSENTENLMQHKQHSLF